MAVEKTFNLKFKVSDYEDVRAISELLAGVASQMEVAYEDDDALSGAITDGDLTIRWKVGLKDFDA